MLDMQIAGADGTQSHPHDCILGIEDDRLGLVNEGEFSVVDVCQSFHGKYLQFVWDYYSAV
jgi:hypothetical protein